MVGVLSIIPKLESAPKSINVVKIKALWNFDTGIYSCLPVEDRQIRMLRFQSNAELGANWAFRSRLSFMVENCSGIFIFSPTKSLIWLIYWKRCEPRSRFGVYRFENRNYPYISRSPMQRNSYVKAKFN